MFVINHLDGISFSLSHDVITLLESICADLVLKSDVMTEWYHASQVGLNEEEATHVASFNSPFHHSLVLLKLLVSLIPSSLFWM